MNNPLVADDRARLPRHRHAARRPAQRARGPLLVHRLHAVPARDQPGPARGAAELPDDGQRPDRAADLQRLAARRGHRGRRGDDAGPPGHQGWTGRSWSTPTRCRRPSRWCAPAPRRWASRWSSPTWPTGCPTVTLSGVLVQYPGASGRILDPRAGDRGGPRARRPRRGRGRPAGADAAGVARHAGRRRGGRLLAALRRAAVLRRAARRLHVGALRARAAPARPARRGLGRLGRPSGVPALAADPRAAHPPRPGDLQHLHRAGAAGRGGLDVRRLPRPRRAARRSPRATHHHGRRLWPTRLRAGGVEVVHDEFFDTVLARVPGRAAEVVAAARDAGVHVRLVDDDHVGVSTSEVTDADVLDAVLGAFGVRRPTDVDGGGRVAARRPASYDGLPDPRGLQHPPLRDLDAALPAPALGARLRARPRDDPARLVHDEAERDHRDGAGQPAGLRRPAPVRARPRTRSATGG